MRLKGSFTVEASIIIPTFIFIIVIAIRTGLILYQEIATQTEQELVENVWVIDDFYKYQIAKEVMKDE